MITAFIGDSLSPKTYRPTKFVLLSDLLSISFIEVSVSVFCLFETSTNLNQNTAFNTMFNIKNIMRGTNLLLKIDFLVNLSPFIKKQQNKNKKLPMWDPKQ